MAKQTIEVYTDDLSGERFEEGEGRTVQLSLDDRVVELDLTTAHVTMLEEFLDPFFNREEPSSLRRRVQTNGSRRQMPTPRTADNREAMQAIRKWAKRNGYDVSARGRIPYAIMDAYTKAHLLNAGR